MTELACKDVVFHFNKKHLEDSTIPMWVLKTHGKTYYVNHVDCQIPWSTKETPDNPHTKGSIKVKDCLLNIDADNNASLTKLTEHDKIRLRNEEKGITRIIYLSHARTDVESAIRQSNIKHGPIKKIGGRCGSTFYATDIMNKAELSFLTITAGDKFRVLMPNEKQYQDYDDPNHNPDWYWEAEAEYEDDDFGDDDEGNYPVEPKESAVELA